MHFISCKLKVSQKSWNKKTEMLQDEMTRDLGIAVEQMIGHLLKQQGSFKKKKSQGQLSANKPDTI